MRLSRLRCAVALVLVALSCVLAPGAWAKTDYTDIWWAAGGTESGWGANFAQTGDFIFVTFFIYGPGGEPVWYTAQLRRTTGETFSGPVYVVSGTWFGSAFFPPVPPSRVFLVGDATFTAAAAHFGTLRYRIDTVTVNKTIERQTTDPLSVADVYIGGLAGTVSGACPVGGSGSFRNTTQLRVLQSANTVRLEFSGADTTNVGQLNCVMQGATTQYGKLLRASSATYQCATGLNTFVEIESIRQLDDGIEVHWRADVGGGCIEKGRVTAVKQ
jgi:hypothetical protein